MWVKFYSMLLLLCAIGQGFTRRRLSMINVGVNLMMKTTMHLMRRRTAIPTSLRIGDVAEDDEDDGNRLDVEADTSDTAF
jgi:hypothetical protein